MIYFGTLLSLLLVGQSPTGDLQVTCHIGGRIYLDDRFIGVCAAVEDGKYLSMVPAGSHTVRVEQQGFQPAARTVVVPDGGVVEARFELLVPASTPNRDSASTALPSAASTPISYDTLLALLQNGVPSVRIEQQITERGITFSLSPAAKDDLRLAGASDSLLAVLDRTSSRVLAYAATAEQIHHLHASQQDHCVGKLESREGIVSFVSNRHTLTIGAESIRSLKHLMGFDGRSRESYEMEAVHLSDGSVETFRLSAENNYLHLYVIQNVFASAIAARIVSREIARTDSSLLQQGIWRFKVADHVREKSFFTRHHCKGGELVIDSLQRRMRWDDQTDAKESFDLSIGEIATANIRFETNRSSVVTDEGLSLFGGTGSDFWFPKGEKTVIRTVYVPQYLLRALGCCQSVKK